MVDRFVTYMGASFPFFSEWKIIKVKMEELQQDASRVPAETSAQIICSHSFDQCLMCTLLHREMKLD